MARLLLYLLGPFQATFDGEPITRFESNKVRALLAYLATEAGRPHHRATLAGLLWPEQPDRVARAYLRNALHDLRQAIGDHDASPPFLQVDRSTIQLDLNNDCWIDVQAFRSLVESDLGGGLAQRQLEEAVDLYRGHFLEGFSLEDSPPFEEWSLVAREQLERQVSSVLYRLAARYEEHGEYARACEHARRRVELEPWNEEAHQHLMRLLALGGQRSAALVQYEACRRLLAQELDVEPSEGTIRLYERIRDEAFGSLREAARKSPDVVQKHNLPITLAPLIGRSSDLAKLDSLLEDPGLRLITLSGPGGSGKTRLALEVAMNQIEHYADGVFFVGLAGVGPAEAIVSTVVKAVGCPLYGTGDPLHQLLEYLRDKEMLLILDDIEHLLAGQLLTRAVITILEAAAHVKILATSRRRLGIQSEQLYPVGGLDLPSPGEGLEETARHGAVELFVAGARWLRPDFELVQADAAGIVHICRLVHGMPLAILLAAAWVEVMTPGEIATQIERGLDLLETDWRDIPVRQHSMRAVFDHSWRLLLPQERLAMAALSVFQGGFTQEAAQKVAGASLHDLMALVNWSLLDRTDTGRFEVHELLRQYSEEKLGTTPGAVERVRDLHSLYYTELLHCQEADMVRGYTHETLQEIDNIRAGWDWAAQHGKAAEIRKSSLSLWLVHNALHQVQEGAAVFARAVEGLRRNAADESRATRDIALGFALGIQGHFCARSGDTEQAARLVQEALSTLERYGPGRELAWCKFVAARFIPEHDSRYQQILEESLALSQKIGFHLGTVLALGRLRRFEEALQESREAGNRRHMAIALRDLGDRAYARRAYAEAGRLYEEGLALAEEVNIQWYVAISTASLGNVALAQGQYETARARYEQALAHATRIRFELALLLAHSGLGRLALAMQDPATAMRHYRHALDIVAKAHLPPYSAFELELRLDLVLGIAVALARAHGEYAAELAALARHHPSSTEETKDGAQRLLDGLEVRLASAAFLAAVERGQSRDLGTTLRELIEALGNR